MKKWVISFIACISIIILTLIIDAYNPSDNVLKDTQNMVYEQMTPKQQEAMKIEEMYQIVEVIFAIGAVISAGGVIFEVWNVIRRN